MSIVEVINIKILIQSDKKDMKEFLKELKEILNAKEFNVDKDLMIVKSKKDGIKYSTSLCEKH